MEILEMLLRIAGRTPLSARSTPTARPRNASAQPTRYSCRSFVLHYWDSQAFVASRFFICSSRLNKLPCVVSESSSYNVIRHRGPCFSKELVDLARFNIRLGNRTNVLGTKGAGE